MSEARVSAGGHVVFGPVDHSTDLKSYAAFRIRWTPSTTQGDGEQTLMAVSASGALADDILAKIRVGDRVQVEGRLGTWHGQHVIYAYVVAVDLRSLDGEQVAS